MAQSTIAMESSLESATPASDTTESRPGGTRLHVAIIMDGNGRWARQRGLARAAGHVAGANAVVRVVDAAEELAAGEKGRIGTLTLFAFSGDNWQRPPSEVESLMRVFEQYLLESRETYPARGIRLSVVGRRDRLDLGLLAAVESIERATASGRRLDLRLAIDYSARDAVVRAARIATCNGYTGDALTREAFASLVAEANHAPWPSPEIDLLTRSGGEQRLSDCLLWELAYAEMVFSERLWPDFTGEDLRAALAEFDRRERRFGRVTQSCKTH